MDKPAFQRLVESAYRSNTCGPGIPIFSASGRKIAAK
jgi:hypothetical protein